MQKFPELLSNQVALLRAQFSTGHVLDINYNVALNEEQIVYTIFDDVNKAIDYAHYIIRTNSDVEVVVYGENEEIIRYITPD